MPMGTGAETLQNIPVGAFVVDPDAFFQMTRAAVATPAAQTHVTGSPIRFQLPQSGVVSKVRLIFQGSLVVATAAATTSDRWPYGLLSDVKLSANGQNDLISCTGEDLNVLRFLRNPAYEEFVDLFTGTVGGGNSVAVGTYPLYLTWELPIAMDDTTLVGSLFAQSGATNLSVALQTALMADLFSANPGNATITGTWSLQETWWEIPFDAEDRLVIPDLTKLHGINALDTPYVAVGESSAPLIRSSGQLARLLYSGRYAASGRLSAAAGAAATRKIDQLRIEYGGNQRPYVFNPATSLLSINNNHYGLPLPYDYLALDLVRENPPRDAIHLQGVTELKTVITVGSGVTVTAGKHHLVQETLF